jgi:hypothetical protein
VTGVGARNDRQQSIITVDVPAVQEYVRSLVSGTPPPAPPPVPPVGNLGGNRLLDLSGAQPPPVPCVD